MIGFAIGLACLYGLFRVLRGGRRWRRHGAHHHRRSHFLHRLFQELDTTPGQERVIHEAVDELRAKAEQAKDGLFDAKGDVAEAFRKEHFDEEIMADLLGRFDERVDELRTAFVGSLAKVHEALDPEQRERLASWMGRARRRWAGPYRTRA